MPTHGAEEGWMLFGGVPTQQPTAGQVLRASRPLSVQEPADFGLDGGRNLHPPLSLILES